MSISIWVLLLLAVLTANFPFITERFLGVIKLKNRTKAIALRLLELMVFYLLFIVLGSYLESTQFNTVPKGWQFYAITLCVFLVFAYPGYVYRYLRKSNKR